METFLCSLNSNSGIVALTVSDHLPVYCFGKRAEKPKDFEYIKARSYRNFSEVSFANALSNADLSPCLNSLDVDDAWESFRDIFLSILDCVAPFKNMKFDNLLSEWMTRECLRLMRQRYILDAKSRKKPTPFNKLNASMFRNVGNNMKTNLKRQYYVNAISEAKCDTRMLWKVLKSMLNCS